MLFIVTAKHSVELYTYLLTKVNSFFFFFQTILRRQVVGRSDIFFKG